MFRMIGKHALVEKYAQEAEKLGAELKLSTDGQFVEAWCPIGTASGGMTQPPNDAGRIRGMVSLFMNLACGVGNIDESYCREEDGRRIICVRPR
ncbi:MAG: hypothetical protein WC797_00755 [Candidatus Paceibacterota bacterium]|jgi:hypothetical protein